MRKPLHAVPLCAFVLPGFLTLTACVTVQNGAELRTTFDSGIAAYDAGDYPKAYKIWSGIEDQDLAATRNVAMMLRQGTGVAKNPRRAAALFELASEAGLPTAQADLADMYLKGELGPPNPRAALPLLQQASAADHPVAEYELAQMYETGGLVPKDPATARKLYAAAARHGMKQAQDRLDQMGPEPIQQPVAPADSNVRLMQPAPAAGAQAGQGDQTVRLMQPAPKSPATPAADPLLGPGQP
jgi:TPR repeat protein